MVRRDTVCCDALNFGFFFSRQVYIMLWSIFSPFFFSSMVMALDLIFLLIYYFLEVFCQIADQLCKRNTLKIYFDFYQLELGSLNKLRKTSLTQFSYILSSSDFTIDQQTEPCAVSFVLKCLLERMFSCLYWWVVKLLQPSVLSDGKELIFKDSFSKSNQTVE